MTGKAALFNTSHNHLGDQKLVDAVLASFAAKSALLHATEGRGGITNGS